MTSWTAGVWLSCASFQSLVDELEDAALCFLWGRSASELESSKLPRSREILAGILSLRSRQEGESQALMRWPIGECGEAHKGTW